jgi:hypothetical protein
MAIRIPLVQINGRLRELPAGDKISTGDIATYIHIQDIPSDTWVIEHNMQKNPSVSVILDNGTEVYGLKVYDSENQVTLSFSRPITGKAFLN